MSKKSAKPPAEFPGSPWTNLPPDLLLKISSFLLHTIDLLRFRRVCTSWRSSIPPIPNPNIISSLFSGRRLIPNGIYLLKNESLTFILSLQESQPGNLLLRHPLTHAPIIDSVSADSLDSLASGWTITGLALSHSLQNDSSGKACFIPQFHSSGDEECDFYATGELLLYSKTESSSQFDSLVNFCGSTYAVNHNTV